MNDTLACRKQGKQALVAATILQKSNDKKMKTALDWLVSELPTIDWSDPYYRAKLEEAKAMERQQIATAYDKADYEPVRFDSGEQYYNETFNTKEK